MLENEFKDEEPKWIKFNDLAADVVALSECKSFCAQVVGNVDELNQKWKNFGASVHERAEALQKIKTLSNQFDALQQDIKYSIIIRFFFRFELLIAFI